jgi:uncharacterized protein YceH (UPF0502 family)
MYRFEDLEGVHAALQLLMKREPPVVKVLPKQSGTKEVRYAHLLSGDPEAQVDAAPPQQPAAANNSHQEDRLSHLENEIAGLKKEIADLRQQVADFRKQFE